MFPGITTEETAVFQWGVVIGASLAAAIVDLRTRRIPNAITLPLLATGLLLGGLRGGLEGFFEAAGACVLVASPFVITYFYAGGGAGDAKLMGGIGAWLGMSHGVTALLGVGIAGIVLAVGKLFAPGRLKLAVNSTCVSVYTLMFFLMGVRPKHGAAERPHADGQSGREIPYGVAIFAGVLAAGVSVFLWQG